MKQRTEFDDIRPLYDEEISEAIEELLNDSEFKRVVYYLLPDTDWDAFTKTMRSFKTKHEFQTSIVRQTIKHIAGKTMASVDLGGIENIKKERAYTYISNHRDIIMDASLLCVLLVDAGLDTTEIAIGDNLLIHPWIDKLVRINKSFIVRRGVSIRQMLEVSTKLSQYIHYTINDKNQSVWIAQREGRAKDSCDVTQESLLKMLSLAGSNFAEGIQHVNIVPLSISYEYDPCDYLKAKEFQLKRDNPEYKKSPLDDLMNMETGLMGAKGNVHFQIARPINPMIQSQRVADMERQEQPAAVAALINKEIHLNYKFFPINYMAYDKLSAQKRFEDKYTTQDVEAFNDYIQQRLDLIQLDNKDIPYLTEKLLDMYANPLKNYLIAKENEDVA